MNLYPRSFLGLIVLGSMLAMLPLLGAIGYASYTLQSLTRRSDDAVRQASQVATLSYALDEELGQMERIVRQYEALRDPMLLADYASVRRDWQQTMAEYAAIPLLADVVAQAEGMRRTEADGFAGLAGGSGLADLKGALGNVRREVPLLLDRANRLMTAEREVFRSKSQAVLRQMAAALVAALMLTALTLWWDRRMLARLLAQLERAVVALGEGRLKKEIRLQGPADLRGVGLRLDWLRRRLLALETERTRVLRHVTHELKTPLTTIREGASLLADGVTGPLTAKQEKVAGIMQANAMRLQGLIEGLLSMQHANHTRDHLETGAIRLDLVVRQTLATHQVAMGGRDLRFSGALAPVTVEGSGEALATLASNLISNAIKYSPQGGLVHIEITSRDGQAVLDVMDEGPGVRAEDRERIFEPFFRGAVAQGVDGAGIGLTIAREFALAHGGSLENIEAERGGHFRLKLPLAARSPA